MPSLSSNSSHSSNSQSENNGSASCAGFLILMSILGFTLLSVQPNPTSNTFLPVACKILENFVSSRQECACSVYCTSTSPCLKIIVEFTVAPKNKTVKTLAYQNSKSLFQHGLCSFDIASCHKYPDVNFDRVLEFQERYPIGNIGKCFASKLNYEDVVLGPPIFITDPDSTFRELFWPIFIFVLGIFCLLLDKDTRNNTLAIFHARKPALAWMASKFKNFTAFFRKKFISFLTKFHLCSNLYQNLPTSHPQQQQSANSESDAAQLLDAPPAYSEWPQEEAIILRRFYSSSSTTNNPSQTFLSSNSLNSSPANLLPTDPPPIYSPSSIHESLDDLASSPN
eukprot:Sdes_comp15292_c0_seq1m4142